MTTTQPQQQQQLPPMGPSMPTDEDRIRAERNQAQIQAENALRVAERFCTNRSRCRADEMIHMFKENATLVTINNCVFGKKSIFAALDDGMRFTHLSKYFRPWRVCANTLESSETNENVKKITTLEREGRIFTGMWFYDPRFMYVRETCVVEDNQIKLFSTQRKF